jgi:hypothetical protein
VITPIIKNTSLDHNDLKSYRPVSSFPTIVKIIEIIIAKQISNHLVKNTFYDPYQSAYRPNHSCETAILSILNDLYCAADRKMISLLALLDMSTAFDTVDHDLLLQKLQKLGVIHDALQLIKSYLGEIKTTAT